MMGSLLWSVRRRSETPLQRWNYQPAELYFQNSGKYKKQKMKYFDMPVCFERKHKNNTTNLVPPLFFHPQPPGPGDTRSHILIYLHTHTLTGHNLVWRCPCAQCAYMWRKWWEGPWLLFCFSVLWFAFPFLHNSLWPLPSNAAQSADTSKSGYPKILSRAHTHTHTHTHTQCHHRGEEYNWNKLAYKERQGIETVCMRE